MMSTSCHHSLVFGQIVLLVWVKKNAFSRIHQLMRELEEAPDYACSHLFLEVFFFCLQCYQQFQNAAIQ